MHGLYVDDLLVHRVGHMGSGILYVYKNDGARQRAGARRENYGCGCDTWKQATSYCETAFGLVIAPVPVAVPGPPVPGPFA